MIHLTNEEVAKAEKVYDRDCGRYDNKHIKNLADKAVPEELLRRIEKGCPIEAIDEICRDFPLCKYRTQITIHGRFPKLTTTRIGNGKGWGYVNLVKNKNESIGIRWEGIDNEKKGRLFAKVAMVNHWGIVHNSTTYCMRWMKFVTKENCEAVLKEMKQRADGIDANLFFGRVRVFLARTMLGIVAVTDVEIHGFYEKDFDKLLENLTGLTAEQVEKKIAEIKAEREREILARRAKLAEMEKERAEQKAKIEAENLEWAKVNPPPEKFQMVENHKLAAGDVIAVIEKDRDGRAIGWGFKKIKTAFGRIVGGECDEEGNKIGYHRAHEIKKTVGTFFVKVAMKKAVVPAARPTVKRAMAEGLAVEVTENKAKNGIEIRFASKPEQEVIDNLKANGWRWTRFGGCWYNRATDENKAFAENLKAEKVA